MINRRLALSLAVFLSLPTWAQTGPEDVVSDMTQQVLARANQDLPLKIGEVRQISEEIILPNVDFTSMTARAVGQKWRSATEEQRSRLVAGFQSLLVKTYAGAFGQTQGRSFESKAFEGSTTRRPRFAQRSRHEPLPSRSPSTIG